MNINIYTCLSKYDDELQAAIEEGVVVGGGCSLLRLSTKVDGIKDLLDNEEQKVSFHLYLSII